MDFPLVIGIIGLMVQGLGSTGLASLTRYIPEATVHLGVFRPGNDGRDLRIGRKRCWHCLACACQLTALKPVIELLCVVHEEEQATRAPKV